MIFPVHGYDIDIIAGCGVISVKRFLLHDIDIIAGCGVISVKRAERPEAPPTQPMKLHAFYRLCPTQFLWFWWNACKRIDNAQITYMNIIIKLIRHRNHGGYKSVMTSYARAVQLIQPSRMSNNLYVSLTSAYMNVAIIISYSTLLLCVLCSLVKAPNVVIIYGSVLAVTLASVCLILCGGY